MWGVLSELEELKQVPDTSGFQRLNPGDNLTFVSHAWNISLDPTSGTNLTHLCTPVSCNYICMQAPCNPSLHHEVALLILLRRLMRLVQRLH